MKKAFLMVRPNDFLIYGDIGRDGQTQYYESNSFNVEATEEDFVIFEAYYNDTPGGRAFTGVVREMVTGAYYNMQTFRGQSPTDEIGVQIYSNELGLFQKNVLPISEVEVAPIRVSGLFNYFYDNKEAANRYYWELGEFYENARAYKYIYDHSVNGPSDYFIKAVRKGYRHRKPIR